MDDNIAVSVKGVSKSFRLPHERTTSIKSGIVNVFRKKNKSVEVQHALKGISFDIKKGEFFGIVGRNGSGKSTLLKMISGIYRPDKGNIRVNGSLVPFIELGVGFNPELTGRENVYLNGALLGFSKKQIDRMYNDIVEFAELERFMDQKLKNYSSGMQVRLAFSVAIRAESDILVLDEVLAVGDTAFQQKCFDYFMSLKGKDKTVILVTHDMGSVKQYCDRGIMIEAGRVVMDGTPEEIAQEYQKLFINYEEDEADGDAERWGEGGMVIGKPKVVVSEESIKITVAFKATKELPPPVYGFTLHNGSGVNILTANSIKENITTDPVLPGETTTIQWEFPNLLSAGSYTLDIAGCDQSTTHIYQNVNKAAKFRINKHTPNAGLVNPTINTITKERK